MAEYAVNPPSPSSLPTPPPSVDPRSGFDGVTKTFRSLRPAVTLPSPSVPLSAANYAFSFLPSPLPSHPAIVDAATGAAVSFPDLLSQVRSLAASLRAHLGLSNGHVAFILSPSRLEIPVLYLALFSLGAVTVPANPASTPARSPASSTFPNPPWLSPSPPPPPPSLATYPPSSSTPRNSTPSSPPTPHRPPLRWRRRCDSPTWRRSCSPRGQPAGSSRWR